MSSRIIIIGAVGAVFSLSACDNGPSAVETRERDPAAQARPAGAGAASADPSSEASTAAPRTVLTANRRETVDAKIDRLYETNGADFGARSPEDFLSKVRGFTEHPPAGVDTVRRPNGDTLYYQASTNTFAVVARDGTPRTMFKPNDGPAYWAEQKERAPTFGQRRGQN